MKLCGEYLMENEWDEGFRCSLPFGHLPPHRCEGGDVDVNESTDKYGRQYSWVFEWAYAA